MSSRSRCGPPSCLRPLVNSLRSSPSRIRISISMRSAGTCRIIVERKSWVTMAPCSAPKRRSPFCPAGISASSSRPTARTAKSSLASAYELLDYYLGYPRANWPEKFHLFKLARLNNAAKQVQTAQARPAAAGPSLPFDHYVGDYTDAWYGTIKVRQSGKGLKIAFPHSTGMEGPLTHYQYDTFKTNPTLKWVEPAYVTFSVDSQGKIDRVTMKPVSPTADFSWDYQDLLFTRQEGD